jgi:hypothetical protein
MRAASRRYLDRHSLCAGFADEIDESVDDLVTELLGRAEVDDHFVAVMELTSPDARKRGGAVPILVAG